MGPELTRLCRDDPDHELAGSARSAGFTLIELMVVVAVLSVLAVGVGFFVSRSDRTAQESDVLRFQRQVESARARALQGRQKQGLFVTARGFRSTVETVDGWAKPQHEIRWRGVVTLRLQTPRQGPNSPHIVMLPDGRITAFSLSFAPETNTRVICRSDGVAGMSCG
ncbi:prepilin-type N-terminal cleavage/methylation domain-containing protein [Phaeobacter sp. J2-8]|uniref:prepilin-type N-terminal cleavage/methylation domain-containing protein n=1 Tax=Phaeobacter sp. J2-8 TaxID=2931394 RepID=UPI001FD1B46F|nr:prepilin-type N-terminal cleavage/methylation domain-containing protein [Phaeobacter sp. J2-8]MCJ7874790.1 prepilin-type N-terminal cleavage/methylation domain-containing protein [Phaeobacter sp. J2-8]